MKKNHLKVSFDTSQPSIPISITINSGKALETFGWKSETNIDVGIKKTIDWFASQNQIEGEKTVA
jgi:dTDP-D-glucose 4,6-dehydratase